MRAAGHRSWSIRAGDDEELETALWIRAVERIDVPAGGTVPGPLLLGASPPPASVLPRPVGAGPVLAGQWRAWWNALLTRVGTRPTRDHQDRLLGDDLGMLRRVVAERGEDLQRWRLGRSDGYMARRGLVEVDLVNQIQAAVGAHAIPFELVLVLLPVDDDEIRPLGAERYLVPERVHRDDARWLDWLKSTATRLSTP
jgi:hypothetical protein